jgi:hypothetical protein
MKSKATEGRAKPSHDKDQLPGRLDKLQTLERMNAGPVNCIR